MPSYMYHVNKWQSLLYCDVLVCELFIRLKIIFIGTVTLYSLVYNDFYRFYKIWKGHGNFKSTLRGFMCLKDAF